MSTGWADRSDRVSSTMNRAIAKPGAVPAHVAPYIDALEHLKAMMLARVDLSVVLQTMCTEVVRTIPTADLAGITVLDERGQYPQTAASTDARVNDVDADQYRSNEGPCLDAARTRQIVRVVVADVERRWPRFAASVAGIGVHSYLSAPLALDDRHLGALNIYSYDRHGFTDVDEALLRLFVTSIETAVLVSRRALAAEENVDGLETAMKTRSQIDQAKGIIMAMRGVNADDAFAFLSEQSQHHNIKVTEIAASLIASVTADRSDGHSPP
ncbi:GAF and ANTAR domain-containing protein [Rhodococcus fascians]|nr:GAF and ANTAR domain-containing protein [Rhodococcus fascians]MBY3826530.1 GAF and ANTAR domain-containing protein [Rhodococcus fascians]MBY3836991.1 GAF and ANTAR domain-containing protein [Rhodococcus fascians]MBY3865542.1 GAF and ANTAR domain-containing protein [Rhodococcus fascians]MBY3885672.1 GAF and ANTAR domain-containing protein [Rhodococcus fascians]